MNLIENIRKLRKIKEMKKKKIKLNEISDEIIEEYGKKAEERGIKISIDGYGGEIYANELIREAISNIVWNSIIHSKGSEIKIWAEKSKEKGTCIFIMDNGVGIPEDIKKHIFEIGVKGKESSGSGIGLYLVKKIIEGHGGSIEVMDGENGGTLFKICIPDK